MRLEHMTPTHVRRAVNVYLAHAWPEGGPGPPGCDPGDLRGIDDLSGLFARFEKVAGERGSLKRYALRLGNVRYPFMKFVVQEHLVVGEYFFSVDTHDNLEIRADAPDRDQWECLKAFNRTLKAEIEGEWEEVGLPTHNDLRQLMEDLARVEREGIKRRRILVVDDELHVAEGLAALLRARGYEVATAPDGVQALRLIEGGAVDPDLVLLDYEMPQLDGQEVLRRLRADPRTASLPVLLATASSIDLERLQRVSGVLRKPYPRHVLFEMIARLLAAVPG